MFSGPVAAQSWFDQLQDSIGLGEETGDLPKSTLIDELTEALRTCSECVVGRPARRTTELLKKMFGGSNGP